MLITPADVESGVKVSFHACSFKSKSKLRCNPLLKPKTHCHICIYHLAHFHIPQLSKHQHQMIRGVPVGPFQYKFLYTLDCLETRFLQSIVRNNRIPTVIRFKNRPRFCNSFDDFQFKVNLSRNLQTAYDFPIALVRMDISCSNQSSRRKHRQI